MKLSTTCSPMIGNLSDTRIINVSIDKEFIGLSKYNCWKLLPSTIKLCKHFLSFFITGTNPCIILLSEQHYMWLNIIYAKLNARQCWPAVSPRILLQGDWGFCAGAPHGLQLGFGCHVICI